MRARHSGGVLPSAEAWAAAKAKAIQQARPTEVLALVGSGNADSSNHVSDATAFLRFSARYAGLGSLVMAGV